MESLLVGLVQLRASADRLETRTRALALVERAANDGARFILTPENTDVIAPRRDKIAHAEPLDGPFIESFRHAAQKHRAWILVGSFAEKIPGIDKVHNTSVLVRDDGSIAGVYRKIHLFDATLSDGAVYRESEAVVPGNEAVVVETPFGRVGLSICYDLRFPELYRRLSEAGATLLCVPSAFTVPTGRAHWETLLRARAIENLSFVLAPAQVGQHSDERASWGHSLIVGPWGDVLGEGDGEQEDVVLTTLNPSEIHKARAMIPALEHRAM